MEEEKKFAPARVRIIDLGEYAFSTAVRTPAGKVIRHIVQVGSRRSICGMLDNNEIEPFRDSDEMTHHSSGVCMRCQITAFHRFSAAAGVRFYGHDDALMIR